ncbi:MAG: molybdate ABC transporter permease subunit [Halobacteriovoraceae bacterium]|nr:molybdate ABC transporter permease subunit [Halobacteriovoraceae bacterium]
MLEPQDWQAILLSLKLSLIVASLLILISLPLALWFSNGQSHIKFFFESIVSLPIVLPPTVLGFYFLIFFGPKSSIGNLLQYLGLGSLPFSFTGLVIASLLYSLPFVVKPIQNAIEKIGSRPYEIAATLNAGPIDTFFNVILPLLKQPLITAFVLGFAHTMGEFGVVLLMGGSIPGQTKVISIQIYEHVEALEYAKAHTLSLIMLVISFLFLSILYFLNRKKPLELGVLKYEF